MTPLPCPFCGKPPYVGPDIIMHRYVRVRCVNEGCRVMCQTIAVISEEEAIRLWNMRSYERRDEADGDMLQADQGPRGGS